MSIILFQQGLTGLKHGMTGRGLNYQSLACHQAVVASGKKTVVGFWQYAVGWMEKRGIIHINKQIMLETLFIV